MKKYNCQKCGKEFNELWELANHRRHVLAEQRRRFLGRKQIMPMTKNVPKQSKILKVRHDKTSTTIASTFFLPPNWEMVRVFKPVVDEATEWELVDKLWVCFEPIVVTKHEEEEKD